MKYVYAFFATAIFMSVLGVVYYIHMKYFSVNVVFYAAISDVIIAVLITGPVIFFRYFKLFCTFEKLQLVVIWLFIGYSLAISIPTVIDRSLSFYILEKLQQRGGGIQQEKFKEVFTEEYLLEHRLVDVRLTEQIESGTIVIENGCVKLTDKGNSIAVFGRFFRQNLLPKHRLLMGEYTDDLTNPFKNSVHSPDYTCK